MRLLCIDYGEKRVGIALSDEGGRLAFPRAIFDNDKNLIKRIQKLCDEESVKKIILGEARTYQGDENPIMKKIIRFKKNLEKETTLPVNFESEILTSQEARREGTKQNMKFVDDSAAALILQSYINKEREING